MKMQSYKIKSRKDNVEGTETCSDVIEGET